MMKNRNLVIIVYLLFDGKSFTVDLSESIFIQTESEVLNHREEILSRLVSKVLELVGESRGCINNEIIRLSLEGRFLELFQLITRFVDTKFFIFGYKFTDADDSYDLLNLEYKCMVVEYLIDHGDKRDFNILSTSFLCSLELSMTEEFLKIRIEFLEICFAEVADEIKREIRNLNSLIRFSRFHLDPRKQYGQDMVSVYINRFR